MVGKEALPLTVQANDNGGWFLEIPGFADYAFVKLVIPVQ